MIQFQFQTESEFRHARLFELLRQELCAQDATTRLQQHDFTNVSAEDTHKMQMAALQSLTPRI
ncbi:MAG: hypothetical protein WBC93_15615 [Sulfitobacter sp.]